MHARLRLLVLLACAPLAAPVTTLAAQRIKLPVGLDELEKRVRADSNDAAAHYNVALAYWNEKRFDDAERELHTAIAIEPRFAPAHLALACLPYARTPKLWDQIFDNEVPKEMEPALEQSDREYRHAFLIDPLVDLRIIGAVTPPKPDFLDVQDFLGEVYALFFQGFTDCQEGNYEDCNGRFTALIREINGDKHPDRIPNSVLWYQGLAAAHLKQYDLAAERFKTLIDRNIDFEKELEKKGEFSRVPLRTNEYRYTLATILAAAGKTTDAITMFHQVLNEDLGAYMAHVQLAAIYEAGRDYVHAVEERNNAVNANPDDPSLLMDLGVTLGKAGLMPQAQTKLAQAAQANPRDSRVYFWLGLADMDLGKRDEARDALTRFVALAPSRYERQITMAKDRLARLQQ
ncbi:MAG TPA: tetratricopeptide repeat protein [Gemmatimonadales bacterium]|nr:tetratricopeptide repeat protein [Gemmatimonadales bacterium]